MIFACTKQKYVTHLFKQSLHLSFLALSLVLKRINLKSIKIGFSRTWQVKAIVSEPSYNSITSILCHISCLIQLIQTIPVTGQLFVTFPGNYSLQTIRQRDWYTCSGNLFMLSPSSLPHPLVRPQPDPPPLTNLVRWYWWSLWRDQYPDSPQMDRTANHWCHQRQGGTCRVSTVWYSRHPARSRW